MNTNSTPTSLPAFIEQQVKTHWENEHKPLLLSRIGQMAIASGFNLHEALGTRKLAQYIEEELRGAVRVAPSPESDKLLQATPADAGERAASSASDVGTHGPRLNRVLWLAFSRPIAPGFERRLQVEPFVRFWDLAPPLTEVSGRLPVSREYIAASAESLQPRKRDEVIVENIRKWMRDNALDISKFEDGASSAAALPRVAAHNPLMLLIASLDEGEQKRVSLPLDVIAKLLKK